MSRYDPSANSRVIQLLDTDGSTVVETLVDDSIGVDTVTSMSFTLLRQGGCGGATLNINKPFEYNELSQNRYIKATYNGDSVYFGRIENVSASTPSGWFVTTYGLMSILAEIPIGGWGPYDTKIPHLFARSDYYPNDPDRQIQSWDQVSNYTQFVQALYDKYIAPKGIAQGTIESPTPSEVDLYSLVFRGEETVSQVLRAAAAVQFGSSYGVNADNEFFFLSKSTDPEFDASSNDSSVFQEGRDLVSLSKKEDRSLMYNRVLLTGGYVYADNVAGAGGPGFYRYRAPAYADSVSIATHGERPLSLYVPWIRSNTEAKVWLDQFFLDYGGPRTRYSITTLPQDEILFPWLGGVKIYNELGTLLVEDTFDEVTVDFGKAPSMTLTTGIEELQYPTEPTPQRWELQQAGGGGDRINIDGEDSWYSLTESYDFTSDDYVNVVKDITCDEDGYLKIEYIGVLRSVTAEVPNGSS